MWSLWNAVQCVKCGVMRYVVVRCINDVASIWCDLNVAWSTWNVALCGTSVMSNGCNARCGMMHNVADMV